MDMPHAAPLPPRAQGFLDVRDGSSALMTLEALMKNDVMAVLCCPLAQDPVPGMCTGGSEGMQGRAGARVRVRPPSPPLTLPRAATGIQSLSLQCLAKLSAADPMLSQVVVSCGILDSVLASMGHDNAPVQASASDVLAAVSGSGVDFARRVLKAGAGLRTRACAHACTHTLRH